jgi:cell division protein FtsB
MADINLLEKRTTYSQVKERGKRWFLRIVTLVFVLTLALYGYLFFSQWNAEKQIAEHQSVIAKAQSELENNQQREELITRQAQVKKANQLLNDHLFWSGLLPELARVTLTQAQYSSVEISKTGDIFLTVTVPNYEEAEKFLQVFDLPEYNQQFSNVRILALGRAEKNNVLQTTMRLQLTFNPSLLKKPIQ